MMMRFISLFAALLFSADLYAQVGGPWGGRAGAFSGGTLTTPVTMSGTDPDFSTPNTEAMTLRSGASSGAAGAFRMETLNSFSSGQQWMVCNGSCGTAANRFLMGEASAGFGGFYLGDTSSSQAMGFFAYSAASNVDSLSTMDSGTNANLGVYSGANASGEIALTVGSSANTTAQTNLCVSNDVDNDTAACVHRFEGNGVLQYVSEVTANNDLPSQSACAASGDVGKTVRYNDSGSSKISLCVCEQTAAATFAWGAATAAGDCT